MKNRAIIYETGKPMIIYPPIHPGLNEHICEDITCIALHF